ncbi:CIA30 family protein [Polaribacter sp. MED152]|uniref:CIA30 family protein n=1 Tax=Polaribacter sp. MED152 TaxID=313598 RepID=UPI0000689A64|nr:CIA30 family protein [Polaribacter sp. MED152]EAQ40891.3 complex I intermediate-associated protein 30 (CIA30) [Polaribacter sp. MED152]
MVNSTHLLFDFSKESKLSSWRIVDDVVMGGRSNGSFKINEAGNGLFYGDISLKNNGGFSSLRYSFDKLSISNYTKIVLRIKGDGKQYQFRIKDDNDNFYSYIKQFKTSGNWETIEIPLSEMYPAFRGRKLDIQNFNSNTLAQIAFLIGNKKEESFKLEIDKIYLK